MAHYLEVVSCLFSLGNWRMQEVYLYNIYIMSCQVQKRESFQPPNQCIKIENLNSQQSALDFLA